MKQETRSLYEELVRGAVARIALGLDEALNLGELARAAALSPLHFHRIFRGMVGETPLELHRRLRLERAAFLLARTDAKVGSIASEAGYETHESFTRSFREAYASSPSEFRARASEAERSGAESPRIDLSARCGVHFGNRDHVNLSLAIASPGLSIDVLIEDHPERRVAAIPHVGPYYTLDTAFHRLHSVVIATGLWPAPEAAFLTLFHDDYESTPHEQLRSEVGILVSDDAVIPDSLAELRIHAGRYARTTHLGTYERLADTWLRFMGEWLPSSGQRSAEGPVYEVFRDPPPGASLEDRRVDLYLPIA